MTLDEALIECVAGQRITADHMQPGCYVEHTFGRGFVRCWPVAKAELEPERTQCDFVPKPEDIAADWSKVGDQYPKPLKGGWGALPSHGVNVLSLPHKLVITPLDPRKGGW